MNITERSDWQDIQRRATWRLMWWTLAWLLSLALATFGPMLLWQNSAISLSAAGLNFVMGIAMLVANRRQLGSLDDLQQKIQLEAMALALGVTVVLSMTYTTLERLHLLDFRAGLSQLMFLIGITYLVGVILGVRKYR